MFNLLTQYIPIIIPILATPIFMRLVISPIILYKLKKRFLNEITSTIKEGWVDAKDIEAIYYLQKNAWLGLNTPFVISYDINFLKNQLKALFIDITQIYNSNSKSQISLEFSIQKILETSFMIFDDLHRDLNKIKLYKFLEKLPITLFLRITKFNSSIRIITQNRVVRIFQKYRVTTKLLRLILTPLIGLPILLTQLIFSLLYTTLFEGYIRFIYGLILIKTGYYVIYLYSDRNSALHNRVSFNHKEIIKNGKKVEERHTIFSNRYVYSKNLNIALELLNSELKALNIIPSLQTESRNKKLQRVYKRIKTTLYNSIGSEFGTDNRNHFDLKPLISMAKKIGKVYYPNTKEPLFSIRAKEFLELGYFLSTVALKSIYNIPTSHRLLDKIPLKLFFDINSFLEDYNLKEYIPKIAKGGRFIKNINSYYWATQMLLKRTHPIVFAASMVTPIIYQQFQENFKEYIYNIFGLLLIDTYESSYLKNNEPRIMNISS